MTFSLLLLLFLGSPKWHEEKAETKKHFSQCSLMYWKLNITHDQPVIYSTYYENHQVNFLPPIELIGIIGWFWHHAETTIAWYQRNYEAQLNCSKKELSLSLWSNHGNMFSGRRSWQTWLCLLWVRAENLVVPCWLIKEKSYVVEIPTCHLSLVFLFLLGTKERYMSMPR